MIQKYVKSEINKFARYIGIVKNTNKLHKTKLNIITDNAQIKPEFCNISVNEECFFKCKMCYKWQPDKFIPKNTLKLTTQDLKKFIAGLREIVEKGFLINFAGGETLLRKDMFEVISYANKLGFTTNLASNGWLITKTLAKEMIDSGLSSINFSIDASTSQIHDDMRGKPGSFDKLMQAIKYLADYRKVKGLNKMQFRIAAQAVICATNLEDIPDLVQMIDRHPHILSIKFNVVMEPNNTGPNPNWYKEEFSYLWPKDLKIVDKIFNELIILKENNSKIPDELHQLEAYRRYFKDPKTFVKQGSCNFDKSINLSSTGDMFLCFNYACIGNIKNTTFQTAWQSQKAFEVRREIIQCSKNCHFLINCNLEED